MKYPMKLSLVISLMISGLQLMGCATVTRGTKEVLEIKTSFVPRVTVAQPIK